jgi:hypothetical protein
MNSIREYLDNNGWFTSNPAGSTISDSHFFGNSTITATLQGTNYATFNDGVGVGIGFGLNCSGVALSFYT